MQLERPRYKLEAIVELFESEFAPVRSMKPMIGVTANQSSIITGSHMGFWLLNQYIQSKFFPMTNSVIAAWCVFFIGMGLA